MRPAEELGGDRGGKRESANYKRLDDETSIWWCAECGAVYRQPSDSCALRFGALLALDHSRREPWGSRHGLAFAAFALQHPQRHAASLDRAWATLFRIYVVGDRPDQVFERLRTIASGVPPEWLVLPRPSAPVEPPRMTIVDMGEFVADRYAAQLDDWCRASLAMWGHPVV
ncbi:MAG TPA: DUF5946 family protein [Gemmatimonadaceae bacterium]|nr:DUF5946 family protein [Gemmatimonadaceae bacterium]